MEVGRVIQLLTGGFLLLSINAGNRENPRKLQWKKPEFDNEYDVYDIRNETINLYISQWNSSNVDMNRLENDNSDVKNEWESTKVDINELDDENESSFSSEASEYNQDDVSSVADGVFESSSNNSAMILTDLSKCLTHYNLFTCVKLLLLSRTNSLLTTMEMKNISGSDLNLFHGLINLKWLTEEGSNVEMVPIGGSSLDHLLTSRILKIFKSRSLQVSLLPGFGLEIMPKPKADENGFVCFSAKTFVQPNFNRTAAVAEMRKKMDGAKKKKKGGFDFMPMMIVPQMIMLGMLPFALANLKMMVMNAFMINSMALNSAIFMTIRNLVFGPKKGPRVKYVNYGYNKKSKKPEVILHSPAAFVKKPPRHEELHLDTYRPYSEEGGPYIRRTNSKRRQGEIQKQNFRRNNKQRIRTKLEDTPSQVQKVISQMAETYQPEERPLRGHDSGEIQNLYEPSFENTGVDAPSSYLSNGQFLLPGSGNGQQAVENSKTQSDPSRYNDLYQAYNNIHLLNQPSYGSTVQGTGEGSDFRNKFSSKYNNNQDGYNVQDSTSYQNDQVDNVNYYGNHRLS